jgi:hypothetical protein
MIAVSNLLSSQTSVPSTPASPAPHNPIRVAEAMAREMIAPRAVACRKRLQRAREKGQVRSGVAVDTAVEPLYGPWLRSRPTRGTRPVAAKPGE